MPAVNLSPIFNGWQGFTPTGLPMSGGFLYTYQAGTSTPLASYTTNAGTVANSTPITLGSDGRPPNEIWLVTISAYKFVLTDSLLNVIGTYDNITGIDNSVPAALSEWVVSGLTPAYVSATQFTLAGNQTALFEVGRRVRYTIGAGQYTGSITASVFGAITTVTVVTDSIPLDGTLSAVDYGFLDALKPSVSTAFKSAISAPSISTTGAATIGGLVSSAGVTSSAAVTGTTFDTPAATDLSLRPAGVAKLTAATTGTVNIVDGSGKLLMAGGITRFYSGEIAVPTTASASNLVFHGGPRVPDITQLVLRCKIADASYTVGDEVIYSPGDAGDTTRQSTITSTSSSIIHGYISAGAAPAIRANRGTGALTTITAANWVMVIRCIWL